MGGEVFTVNRRERPSPEAGYSEFNGGWTKLT